MPSVRPSTVVCGLLCLVALPGCPVLALQADVQSACVTYSDIQVDAMPPVMATMEQSFTVNDISSLQQLTSDGFQLTFERGDIVPDTGITSLGFVDSAQISVSAGSGSATPAPLDFSCANCGSDGSALAFEPDGSGSDAAWGSGSAIDAAPYFANGAIVVTVDLTGTPPATAWAMNVDVCVTATASYELSE